MNPLADDLLKRFTVTQPPSRKSRSISRYFLGGKRSSIDHPRPDQDIYRCLISAGIFDSYDRWTNITLFRAYSTCRRLFIITNQNELIIGKYHHRQFLFKLKYRIDLNRLWFDANIPENIASEITSLNYYDPNRSMLIGWPLAENFIVEFDTKSLRDSWKERLESTLHFWWQLNESHIEHVRIVIDQNYQCHRNDHSASFLIRKVIGIRPQETVRDLIKKCIEAFHLRDPLVDNYILFVKNHQSNTITPLHPTPTGTQSISPIPNIPLIATKRSKSLENIQQRKEGHEYPYSIKMKHLKTGNTTMISNRSFDADDHMSLQTHYNSSSTSLNNVTTTSYHDFELRKRDTLTDNQSKKHRFFQKRKTKTHQQSSDDYHSSSTPYLSSPNFTPSYLHCFGQKLDDLIQRYDEQLPPIIMQLLEILYLKGPETTGIFRKVANTRSVKDCIDKIERNLPLPNDDLHPILVAGIFKHFLRTLPEPLFNSSQYDNWKKCLRLSTLAERISFARKSILSTLSKANHLLLKGFICILHHISESAVTNGMNPFNLGLCVSNSLFKTESTTITSGKQEADVMSSIVEFLIQNCSPLFGSDIFNCIIDKHILVHQTSSLTYPTASSVESLDEVESSSPLPLVNRSHDSGLAASDQPFNDDSSEISEHFRRHLSPAPDWKLSIACGKGLVYSSVLISNPTLLTTSVTRRRSSKNNYKPSKQFLEREKLTINTTDDSDHNSSIRSSATTIHNITIGKIKRSKSLSRHSSLGSGEYKQQHQKQLTKESRRLTTNDMTRASSFKQIHQSSDEAGDDDDEQKKNNNNTSKNERRMKSKTLIMEESISTRSTPSDQRNRDLTSKRVIEPSIPTSPPVHTNTHPEPHIGDSRSRPLAPTTNKIYSIPQPTTRFQHFGPANTSKISTDRSRIFVHHIDSRPFVLGTAIQMKPIDDFLISSDKRRPCHRQNALRYKTNEQERQSRISAPILTSHYSPMNTTSRYQSIERRMTLSPQPPMKSFSFDINHEFHPSDISWSVREKAKLFEHANQPKLSTGRENYV